MDVRYLEILLKRQNLSDTDIDILVDLLESRRSCNRGTQLMIDHCRVMGITHDAWGFFVHNEDSLSAIANALNVDWEYVEQEIRK